MRNEYVEDSARRVKQRTQEKESHVEKSELLIGLDFRQTQAGNKPVDVPHCEIVYKSHCPSCEGPIYDIEDSANVLVECSNDQRSSVEAVDCDIDDENNCLAVLNPVSELF